MKGSSQTCRLMILRTPVGLGHTDMRTRLRTMTTWGGHKSQQAASSRSSGQKLSLPRSGWVPDGKPRVGLSSALPGHELCLRIS